jgi:hypothetical protein
MLTLVDSSAVTFLVPARTACQQVLANPAFKAFAVAAAVAFPV